MGFDAVSAAVARQLLGESGWIGISTHRPEELADRMLEDAKIMGDWLLRLACEHSVPSNRSMAFWFVPKATIVVHPLDPGRMIELKP